MLRIGISYVYDEFEFEILKDEVVQSVKLKYLVVHYPMQKSPKNILHIVEDMEEPH